MSKEKAASETQSPSIEGMEVAQKDKAAEEAEVEGAVAEEGGAEADGDEEEEGDDENEFEVEAIADHKQQNVSSGHLICR